MPKRKPKITGTGTNADGNDWTSYDDGSFHYNNSNGKENIVLNLVSIC